MQCDGTILRLYLLSTFGKMKENLGNTNNYQYICIMDDFASWMIYFRGEKSIH